MIHKQGAEYKDDSEIEAVIDGGDGEGSNGLKSIALIALFVLGVVVTVLIAVLFSKSPPPPPDQEVQPSSNIDVGSDDYWGQYEPAFAYTAEEKAQLRAWGYTGEEIESAQVSETDVASMIAASKQLQEEARATLSNPESPEYISLLNNTWLGQQPIALPAYVENVTEGSILYNTYTFNADYDKIPAHGHNLFLKVYLEDGSYSFMECPLTRYLQLADSGNIVVTYQTATIDGTTIVYSMAEVTV